MVLKTKKEEDLVYVFIGNKIKRAREEAGFTQDKLAKSIGVSRASLANYETGKTAIYISDLYNIAGCLNKEIAVFLPAMEELRSKLSFSLLVKRYRGEVKARKHKSR